MARALRAVIFDFDGVIANTEPLHLKAFQEVLAAEGVELTAKQYAARYLGLADAAVFRGIAADLGIRLHDDRLAAMLRRKAQRYQELTAGSEVLIEGVADKIREWSERVPLAIASGALRVEVEGILRSADLVNCFTAIVTAEDVEHGKPAPDPYLVAISLVEKAGGNRTLRQPSAPSADSRDVVAIEDAPAGIAAAQAAGMRTVAVTTNYPADVFPHADLVVRSVADLDLEILEISD